MSATTRPAPESGRTRRQRWSAIATGLGPFVRPHRRQLGLALLASVVVTAAQLALPWPLKGIVDTATTPEAAPAGSVLAAEDPVVWFVGAFVLAGIVLGLAEFAQRTAVARFVVPTINDARMGIFTRALDSGPAAWGERDPGDVLTRVVGDTARLRVGLKGVLVHVLQHGLFLVGVSAVLLALDVVLGLTYLGGLLLALSVAVVGTDLAAAMARRQRGRESRRSGTVLQTAAVPGAEMLSKDPERERPIALITQIKGRTAWTVQGALGVTACVVLVLAVRRAEAGLLDTGDIAVVASYLLMLHYPMMRLGRQITRLGPQLTSAERLARLAEQPGPEAAR